MNEVFPFAVSVAITLNHNRCLGFHPIDVRKHLHVEWDPAAGTFKVTPTGPENVRLLSSFGVKFYYCM